MSGWLEWFEKEIICPKCGQKFFALFCEDGDINTIPPTVKCFIADEKTTCPKCGTSINEDYLSLEFLE